MQFVKVSAMFVLVGILAGCGTKPFATATGACEGRTRATVQMFGLDPISQDFLDETIEGNIIGCGHAPPAARTKPVVLVQVAPVLKAAPKPKPAKRKWYQLRTPTS